jgi:hypothetical protein
MSEQNQYPLVYPLDAKSVRSAKEAECESFWGYSWLTALLDSRSTRCLPGGNPTSPALEPLGEFSPLAGSAGGARPRYSYRSLVTNWGAASGANFLWMRNAVVDFGQMGLGGNERTFGAGFGRVSCTETGSGISFSDHGLLPSARRGTWDVRADADNTADCDEVVTNPTIIVSHDDIGNTFHNSADQFRVFLTLAVAQTPRCVSTAEAATYRTADSAPPSLSAAARKALGSGPFHSFGPADSAFVSDEVLAWYASDPCPAGTTVVWGTDPAKTHIVNMDARIMCGTLTADGVPVSPEDREDCRGPYFPAYDSWAGAGVQRAKHLQGKKLCYSSIGYAGAVPESHVWSFFHVDFPCSLPSPLFQRFGQFLVERLNLTRVVPRAFRSDACRVTARLEGAPAVRVFSGLKHRADNATLPIYTRPVDDKAVAFIGVDPFPVKNVSPEGTLVASASAPSGTCRPFVQVLYVYRGKKPFSTEPVRNRVVANNDEFVHMLLTADPAVDVRVLVVDFSNVPYAEQIRTARESHLLIGMHGAGLSHAHTHAAHDECVAEGSQNTGTLEMFPFGLDIRCYQHFTRWSGKRYFSFHNTGQHLESPLGPSTLDIPALTKVYLEALTHIVANRKPECLPQPQKK